MAVVIQASIGNERIYLEIGVEVFAENVVSEDYGRLTSCRILRGIQLRNGLLCNGVEAFDEAVIAVSMGIIVRTLGTIVA